MARVAARTDWTPGTQWTLKDLVRAVARPSGYIDPDVQEILLLAGSQTEVQGEVPSALD